MSKRKWVLNGRLEYTSTGVWFSPNPAGGYREPGTGKRPCAIMKAKNGKYPDERAILDEEAREREAEGAQ